jgi:Cu(I)/Ag(I) efflux system membrane fusion protein
VKGSWRLVAVPLLAATCSVHAADDARTPLYYQDPSGAPFYAAGPKKTPDQRDYVPVFEDQPAVGSAAAAAPGGGMRRILYYRNPMGLPDTSPVPKKDSMGMDYLPVYADEDTAGNARGTVRISQGRIQTLGVRTEEAVMRPPLIRTIRATGALQFDERRLATVTTKVPGWLERLAVAATGDPVQRGQVLAEIYAPDLVAAEEEYLVAARMGGTMSGGSMAGTMAHGDPDALAAASLRRLRALDVPEEEIARLRKSGKAPIPIWLCARPCMRASRSRHRPQKDRCWRSRPPPSSTAVRARWCLSIAAREGSSRVRFASAHRAAIGCR